MKTFTVRTQDQAVIFEHELRGQLSDGHWENSRPMNHWKNWCDAEVKVGEQVGRNFYADRKYNFASRELLAVVEPRMITYVKIAQAYGSENCKLVEYLYDLYEEGEQYVMRWKGLPTYEGKYWDEKRVQLNKFAAKHGGLDLIHSTVDNVNYGHKALMSDLKELNAAQHIDVRQVKQAEQVDTSYVDFVSGGAR